MSKKATPFEAGDTGLTGTQVLDMLNSLHEGGFEEAGSVKGIDDLDITHSDGSLSLVKFLAHPLLHFPEPVQQYSKNLSGAIWNPRDIYEWLDLMKQDGPRVKGLQ